MSDRLIKRSKLSDLIHSMRHEKSKEGTKTIVINNNVYAYKWKPDSYCKFIKRLCFTFVSTSRFVRACIHRKIELLERQKHSSFPQIYRISFHNRLLRTPYHPRNTLTPSILFTKKKKKKKRGEAAGARGFV